MSARKSVALIAAQACTLSLIAYAPVSANPHVPASGGYRPPFHPVRSAERRSTNAPLPETHVVHLQPPQLQVPQPGAPRAQQFLYVPGYIPFAFPTFGSVWGAGFMGDTALGLQSSCRSHQGMTLGELAPGGNTSFAPVTQEMIGNSATPSSPNWLSVLTGVTPLSGSGSQPWQSPQSSDLHCTNPQNDLPDVNLTAPTLTP